MIIHTELILNPTNPSQTDNKIERRLDLQQNNMNTGYYMNKLLQTHNVSNMALMQNQRQEELNLFDKSFKNIDYKIDEFRDNMAKKLFELKSSLERPKVPILGVGKMMNMPYSSPLSNSDLSKFRPATDVNSLLSMKNNFQDTMSKIQNAQDSLMSMAGGNNAKGQNKESKREGERKLRNKSKIIKRGKRNRRNHKI